MWLLVGCLWLHAGCRIDGDITVNIVTKDQCMTVLENSWPGTRFICISPSGDVFRHKSVGKRPAGGLNGHQ